MHPSNSYDPTPQRSPVSGGSSADNTSSRPQTLRATWHDYRQRGVYMLTICTEGRRPMLGRLVADEAGQGAVRLTPLGTALERALEGLRNEYAEVEFIRWVVMPDHLHVVVQVHQVMDRHLGEVVRRLKYLSTVAYLRELDEVEGGRHRIEGSRLSKREREAMKRAAEERRKRAADGPQSTGPSWGTGEGTTGPSWGTGEGTTGPSWGTGEGTTGPSWGTGEGTTGPSWGDGEGTTGPSWRTGEGTTRPSWEDGHEGGRGDGHEGGRGNGHEGGRGNGEGKGSGDIIFVKRLWQENYHDRVLTEYGQLTKMLNYVEDNPRRAWIKKQHPRLFYDKWTLDLPLPVELARALYREARALGEVKALEECLIVDRSGEEVRTSLRFRAMGNCFLANETVLVPLRMSRRATQAEIKVCAESLDARCIAEGAVVITPCVSQGEQIIVDMLLAAGHRVIRLQHEAMHTLYAPSDRFLPFVASGQMLLLAPWPDLPLSDRPSKGRFELMNAMCRVLCGS